MGVPYTETGYNMYDMLSVVQKSVRRGYYELGGWGCQQLQYGFRSVMWNRMLITSCEDCYGVLTKEIVALREKDVEKRDNTNVANAMALLCRARKSRDACYFACNFVIDSRKPRDIRYTDEMAIAFKKRMKSLREDGVLQESLIDIIEETDPHLEQIEEWGLCLQIATEHRDMDMMGWYLDQLRRKDWNYIWDVYIDYAANHFGGKLLDEVYGLKAADAIFNGKKEKLKKNEIFISKALMIFCYAEDPDIEDPRASDYIQYDRLIDWSSIKVKPIRSCVLEGGVIPEFVFDCHTLKGKRNGKTDWDMTCDEQAALNPLYRAYFDDASWLYVYEQDYREGRMDDKEMAPIWEYAKTHPANPVEPYPYD